MESSRIHIFRERRWGGGARRFKVYLDGERIGRLRNGRVEQFAVPCGAHELQIRFDLSRSPTLGFELEPGANAHFFCDPRAAWEMLLLWPSRIIRRQPSIKLFEDPGGARARQRTAPEYQHLHDLH